MTKWEVRVAWIFVGAAGVLLSTVLSVPMHQFIPLEFVCISTPFPVIAFTAAVVVMFICHVILDGIHCVQEKARQERAKNATAAEKRAMAEALYPELFRPGGPTLLDMARLNHDTILTRPVHGMDHVDMAVRVALEAHLQSFALITTGSSPAPAARNMH